jgi:hypothetical protein
MPLHPRRRRVLLVGLVVLSALAVACTQEPVATDAPEGRTASEVSATLAPPDTADSLLFVARAGSGELTLDADRTGTLELDGVDAVRWFSDRPVRDAGLSSPVDVLRTFGWEGDGDALGEVPPNAALSATELDAASVIVELRTASVRGDTVTFTIGVVSDDAVEASSLSDVELFIDPTQPVSYPVNQTMSLANGLVVSTTVSAIPLEFGIEQAAVVTFTGPAGELGQVSLDEGTPQSFDQTFTAGGQVLTIKDVQLRPVTSWTRGEIVVWATVTDTAGGAPASILTYVAEWG